MSHDGDMTDMNGNAGEVPDIPKHGFGLADSSAQPSPDMAAAAAAAATADGEPVALAAALAFNQAALDGRPLDAAPAGNGDAAVVAASGLVASPRAQPMVRFCFY